MTELETIQRAKMYMDKLAQGINPIDDTHVPESDTINNVRISRCFFFVSDVLRRVIENGGIETKAKKTYKVPFYLHIEERKKYERSDKPIPISEISKRLNALIDPETMRRITYKQIRDWLAACGMIEDVVAADGKKFKQPTEVGMNLGISVEQRIGAQGAYRVVLYNRDAQQFILDNLDAIIPTVSG